MLFQRRDNPVLYSGFFKRVDCRFEPGDALFALVGVYLDQGLQRVDAGIPVAGGAGGGEFFGVEAIGDGSGLFGPVELDRPVRQLVGVHRRPNIKVAHTRINRMEMGVETAEVWKIGCDWRYYWM